MSAIPFNEAERQIVTALLETKAVNFEALGEVIAKQGANMTLQLSGDDVFCGTMRTFVRCFRIPSPGVPVEQLVELRKALQHELRG